MSLFVGMIDFVSLRRFEYKKVVQHQAGMIIIGRVELDLDIMDFFEGRSICVSQTFTSNGFCQKESIHLTEAQC